MSAATFHVDIDATAATFDIGSGTAEATLHVQGGILPAGNAVVYYEAIQPTAPVATQDAIIYEITGAGNAAFNSNAMRVSYLAGYTGPNHNAALYPANNSQGTGTLLFPNAGTQVTCNIGMWGVAQGGGSGVNLGTGGHGVGSTTGNCGVSGLADFATTTGYNIGTSGWAARGLVNIGGWFTLNQTNVPSTSAALIADNGSQSNAVALFQVAGVSKAQVDANGNIGYITGAGGAVTQGMSRLTSVILNKSTGQITLFSGSALANFTVNNTMVAATDVIQLSVASSTNLYLLSVTAVRSNSFDITAQPIGTIVADAPVINFAVIKGANS